MPCAPPVNEGGTPLCGTTLTVGRRGAIVVLSWYSRGAEMVLKCGVHTESPYPVVPRLLAGFPLPLGLAPPPRGRAGEKEITVVAGSEPWKDV